MSRKITNEHPAKVEKIDTKTVRGDILTFLDAHANGFTTLLAHAEDGVVWGTVEAGKWVTPEPNQLRAETLIEARLFSTDAELLVWRDGTSTSGWRARVIKNGKPDGAVIGYAESFDEEQMLWGTQTGGADAGFTEMIDGAQGLRHWVPKPKTDIDNSLKGKRAGTRPLRLVVRHYLVEDKHTGAVRIAASRLVELKIETSKTGGK